MRYLRQIIYPVLLTVILLLAVRGLLLTHVCLPANSAVRGFRPCQHVLVSLTYYGLRVPGEVLWGYHRWGYRIPEKGDPVMFYLPLQKGQSAPGTTAIGICRALPGDSVWIDPLRRRVLPAHTMSEALPMVIPAQGISVTVKPHNVSLLAFMMRHYENCRAQVSKNGSLLINGKVVSQVVPNHDYFWIETRPDTYVLVPHDALVGKVVYAFEQKQ